MPALPGHPGLGPHEGQSHGYPMHSGMVATSRDQQGVVAMVPQHVLQSNPEVLKGQTSPKMAAIEVLDLTKQQASNSGDAPLDLSVKKPEKSESVPSMYGGGEHQNPNWGLHMVRSQEGARFSPHLKSLEDSLHKHLPNVDKPVYPSDLLNRPPLGLPHPLLRPPMHGGITTGQPIQHSNATAEQVAALSMRMGMTPEAFHAAQQQQVAAVSTAQHRYEAQQQNAALLQR